MKGLICFYNISTVGSISFYSDVRARIQGYEKCTKNLIYTILW